MCLSLQGGSTSCTTRSFIVFGALLAFTWNLRHDRFLNILNPITQARIIHIIPTAMQHAATLWFLRCGCYRSHSSQLTDTQFTAWFNKLMFIKKVSLSISILTEDTLHLQILLSASKEPYNMKKHLKSSISPSFSEPDIHCGFCPSVLKNLQWWCPFCP